MYLYLKAFHIIIVIAWIASLLIYPRYKLHQISGVKDGELFNAMQKASARLRSIILTPSLLLAWASGISLLASNPDLMSQGWIHAKLAILLGLSGLHGYFIAIGKKIDAGTYSNTRSLKLLNEAPFVIMIVIVVLAVTKPF